MASCSFELVIGAFRPPFSPQLQDILVFLVAPPPPLFFCPCFLLNFTILRIIALVSPHAVIHIYPHQKGDRQPCTLSHKSMMLINFCSTG